MVRINNVEIKNKSWQQQDVGVPRRTRMSENGMEVVMNKEDGYINGSLLASQLGIFLLREMRDEGIKEDIEHIKNLTGQREMYKVDSVYENVRGGGYPSSYCIRMGSD